MGLKEEGLRAFGSWEPLMHRLRLGSSNKHHVEERYDWEHTEEFIKGLKERGFNLFITHFSKGFGIETEAEERENTRRIVKLCHKHSMYTGGYIRYTTFIPETMANEVPDCVERFGGVNSRGQCSRYNTQYWRHIPCPTSAEWFKYLEELIDIAVTDVGLDCLHFDGLVVRPEPYACHCDRCREKFREWLRERYPTADAQIDRFGFAGMDHIEPPDFSTSHVEATTLPVLSEPVSQEWMLFRCHILGEGWKFVTGAVRRRNPDVIIQGNSKFNAVCNNAWFSGAQLCDLARAGSDGLFSEENLGAGLLPDGRLTGLFETFKRLGAVGIQTFTYNRRSAPDHGTFRDAECLKRSMAHQMAFNINAVGVFCEKDLSPGEWPFTIPDYMSFHRDRRELFSDVEWAHDVALHFSERTYALNSGTPLAAQHLAHRVLLRGHVPFGYLLETRREHLDNFRALVLPETECVTEEEADDLAAYVRQGGGLLVIGANTGRYDSFRREYETAPIMATLGVEWSDRSSSFTARVNEGRVAFLPEFITPQGSPAALVRQAVEEAGRAFYMIRAFEWQPPLNARDVLNLLRWTAGGFRYESTLPDTVVAEFTRQKSTGHDLIHLVNFDVKRDVGPFEILCCDRKVGKAEGFTPDNTGLAVEVHPGPGRTSSVIRVAGFHRYLIISVE